MNIKDFINQKRFDNIEKRLNNVKEEMSNNNFNLFTISSYNSYLENFHSDIIALLLNPKERHNQSAVFLQLFIDFLNYSGFKIEKSNYNNVEVVRESGRIDIWIKDIVSKQSIIVENKINNAGDMEDQLERYYNYAIERGFKVECAVYLTLNGNKNAPITKNQDLNNKMLNISAFTNNHQDLYNGWIQPCLKASKNTEDSSSFIYQYSKLLKHLSQMGLDREIKNDFYEIVNQESGLDKIKAIMELANGLEEYRADVFREKVGNNYAPFKKIYRYKPWHWLFENFNDHGIIYKLDVHFYSGRARIDFWNPDGDDKEIIEDKLDSIGLFEDFEENGFGNGMYKEFCITQEKLIKDVDEELVQYVLSLFEKLR